MPSGLGLARWGRAAALRHVIEEPVRLTVGGPLGAQSGSPLDAAQGRQQEAVELASVGSSHPAVDMETVGGRGDVALDELLEQRPDRAGALRADFGDEMEIGVGHDPSLSGNCRGPKSRACIQVNVRAPLLGRTRGAEM